MFSRDQFSQQKAIIRKVAKCKVAKFNLAKFNPIKVGCCISKLSKSTFCLDMHYVINPCKKKLSNPYWEQRLDLESITTVMTMN